MDPGDNGRTLKVPRSQVQGVAFLWGQDHQAPRERGRKSGNFPALCLLPCHSLYLRGICPVPEPGAGADGGPGVCVALHSSLVAAVLLQHRDTVPARGTGRGSSPGDLPIGEDMQRPPTSSRIAPSSCLLPLSFRPETGHKRASLTSVYPSLTTGVPSSWYHTRVGRPETSSLWDEEKGGGVSAASQGGTVTA